MNLWMLRDDVPDPVCNCHPIFPDRHSPWCDTVRRSGGACYYAGRDLEGHWFLPGLENALQVTYREAQRLRRELPRVNGRRLQIERVRPRVAA